MMPCYSQGYKKPGLWGQQDSLTTLLFFYEYLHDVLEGEQKNFFMLKSLIWGPKMGKNHF